MGVVTTNTTNPNGGSMVGGLSRQDSGSMGFKGPSTGNSDPGGSGDGYIDRLLGGGPHSYSGGGGRPPRGAHQPIPDDGGGVIGGGSGGRPPRGGHGTAPKPPTTPTPTPLVQPPADTSWAYRLPLDFSELLRQLSANVGREAMPGGRGGAVRVPSVPGYGMNTPALTNPIDPNVYGQEGGEATFFTEAIGGGMTPLYAMQDNLGYSSKWDPLGLGAANSAAAAAASKWKPGQPIPAGYKVDPTNPKKIIKI